MYVLEVNRDAGFVSLAERKLTSLGGWDLLAVFHQTSQAVLLTHTKAVLFNPIHERA
jgi:hypothetical protein